MRWRKEWHTHTWCWCSHTLCFYLQRPRRLLDLYNQATAKLSGDAALLCKSVRESFGGAAHGSSQPGNASVPACVSSIARDPKVKLAVVLFDDLPVSDKEGYLWDSSAVVSAKVVADPQLLRSKYDT